jgi:hypothetical protein
MTPQQLADLDAIVAAEKRLRASLADPVPAPPPPPPVEPPAPIPPAPLPPTVVPSAAVNRGSYSPANGIIDRVDLAKIPAPMPWSIFTDDKQTIAPSLGGVEKFQMRSLHVYGHPNSLYRGTRRVIDGAVVDVYPDLGARAADAIKLLPRYPFRDGKRGEHIMTPYTTWHGHTRRADDGSLVTSPHLPMWIGIVLDGRVTYAFRDGSTQTVQKIPVKSYAPDFTFFDPNRKLFFVADALAGEIIRVDRNTTPWTTSLLATGLGRVDSLRAIGPMIYCANSETGAITEVNALTGAQRLVATLPHVFWISYRSDGQLVVMCSNRSIHVVDPASGAIGPDLLPATLRTAPGMPWVQIDVDRAGTCGAVDSMIAVSILGAGNIDFYRFDKTGRNTLPENSKGIASVGAVMHIHDAFGHYPWVAVHHPDDACMMVQGMANTTPQIIGCFDARSTWSAALNDRYTALWERAQNLFRSGGVAADGSMPPSWTTQINQNGGGLWTGDHFAEMPIEEGIAFLRQGGIGNVPRRLVGDDLKAMVMSLSRSSMRYLREGGPFLNSVIAYMDTRRD